MFEPSFDHPTYKNVEPSSESFSTESSSQVPVEDKDTLEPAYGEAKRSVDERMYIIWLQQYSTMVEMMKNISDTQAKSARHIAKVSKIKDDLKTEFRQALQNQLRLESSFESPENKFKDAA